MLETGVTAPCKVELSPTDKTERTLKIILHEGKKRQIRKMLQALGYSVTRLMRLKFAGLTLANLPVGKWRYLTEKEVEYLKRILE
jgi:pseudouridine synthase